MPIDRPADERHPEPRHWCDPASETPDESGRWTCPGCKKTWGFVADERLWLAAEDVDAYLTARAAAAEAVAEAAPSDEEQG